MLKSAREKKLKVEKRGKSSAIEIESVLKSEYGENAFIEGKLFLKKRMNIYGANARRKTEEREENRGLDIRISERRDSKKIVSVISITSRLNIRKPLLFSPFKRKERSSSKIPRKNIEIKRMEGHS